MFKFRLAAIAIALMSIIVPASSIAAMQPGTLNVKITPALKAKYPCIKAVLTQLLRTLEDPNSWDTKFWYEKVPTTGTVSNDQFKTVADDMRKYLTDGSVTIDFRPDPKPPRLGRAGGDTPNKNKINLHIKSGSWGVKDQATYSDYDLAVTIFHELMHIWQHNHWMFSGNLHPAIPWDKERAPTYIEPYLPKDKFNTARIPDPGLSNPVPEDCTHWIVGKPEIWKNPNSRAMFDMEKGCMVCITQWSQGKRSEIYWSGIPSTLKKGDEGKISLRIEEVLGSPSVSCYIDALPESESDAQARSKTFKSVSGGSSGSNREPFRINGERTNEWVFKAEPRFTYKNPEIRLHFSCDGDATITWTYTQEEE